MEHHRIKGLYYVPNFLDKLDIKSIETFINNNKKWQHLGKSKNSRRVIHYGYSYAYNRSGIKKLEDIPKILSDLVNKDLINKTIGKNLISKNMDQLIINEYKPGQGIYHHIDHVKYFGPIVLCLTVGSGVEIEFVNNISKHKEILYIEEGSLYIMSGESRYRWKHGIIKRKNDGNKKRGTRYSLTYRTVINN